MDTGSLRVDITEHEERPVVVISGELDGYSGGLASAYLLRQVEQQKSAHWVIDLSEVAFVDSSGLQLLLATRKAVTGQGSLTLARPSDAVGKVLQLTGLDQFFDVDDRAPGSAN